MSNEHELTDTTEHGAKATAESQGSTEPNDVGAPVEAAERDSLAAELEEARTLAEERWNELLRAKAELENLRKRAERDVENAHKYGLEKFILELLPVKDSLELGLSAASTAQDLATVTEGVELTLKMLTAALEKHGVALVDPAGEQFNPDLHQAVSMAESSEAAPGTVMTVIQKGYTLNDRLVRPAMVTVAKDASD
jgi:molecular chaperone GrpE